MSKHSFPFYVEQLEMILAVTKMLNENSEQIPVDKDYYFKVQLVEAHAGEVIGEWSDEIGPDCWEFSLAPSQIAEAKPKNELHNGVVGARSLVEEHREFNSIMDEGRLTIAERAAHEKSTKRAAGNGSVQLD